MNAGTQLRFFALACALTACDGGGDPLDRFTEALPTADKLELDVPGEEVEAIDAPLELIEAPLLGEPSDLRVLTGGVRRYLSDLIRNLTEGVERMTAGRPLFRGHDRAVWRVRMPEHGLERSLVMKRRDGHFDFSVWTRPLGPNGRGLGRWRFLVFGRVTPSGDGDGRGAAWIDLEQDRKPLTRGKMAVLWSVIGDRREIEVAIFDGTPDEGQVGRLTKNFRYQDGPDGGLLAFDAGEIDVHLLPDHAAKERVRVFTRWNAERVVRSDYSARGPDVAGDGFRVLIGGECWRPPDAIVSYETRIGLPLGGGSPTRIFERGDRASCPFPDEDAPIVAPPGAPPIEPAAPDELPSEEE